MFSFLYELISNDSEIFNLTIVTVCSGRLTMISDLGSSKTTLKILSKNPDETWTGKTPIFKQLPLNISAKKLDITHLKP